MPGVLVKVLITRKKGQKPLLRKTTILILLCFGFGKEIIFSAPGFYFLFSISIPGAINSLNEIN